MRSEYPVPDGVIGLIPLHIGYAYEQDDDADVIGVVLDTTTGRFALWLEADDAVQLAGQIVAIVENLETLRERYAQRVGPSAAATAISAAGMV